MATRYLYITRHAEAAGEGTAQLTDTGREQALLLGKRLRDHPVSAVVHGPLPRATQTAELIAAQLGEVRVRADPAAGDYVPHAPDRAELPDDCADLYQDFLRTQPPAEPGLADQALKAFTSPDGRHELLITHNFLIGWLVRAALDAPPWRWLTVNHDNAALTIIRYTAGRPAALICFNDTGHLR